MDASIGADECAGWMVIEVEHAESEAGFVAGLGSGQAATDFFGGAPGTDCGFGMGVVEAEAGAGHA